MLDFHNPYSWGCRDGNSWNQQQLRKFVTNSPELLIITEKKQEGLYKPYLKRPNHLMPDAQRLTAKIGRFMKPWMWGHRSSDTIHPRKMEVRKYIKPSASLLHICIYNIYIYWRLYYISIYIYICTYRGDSIALSISPSSLAMSPFLEVTRYNPIGPAANHKPEAHSAQFDSTHLLTMIFSNVGRRHGQKQPAAILIHL